MTLTASERQFVENWCYRCSCLQHELCTAGVCGCTDGPHPLRQGSCEPAKWYRFSPIAGDDGYKRGAGTIVRQAGPALPPPRQDMLPVTFEDPDQFPILEARVVCFRDLLSLAGKAVVA